VWLIARYGTGLHLHTPAFGPAHRPATLTSGVAVTATASAAACGVLYLIERTARNARRAWILTSLTALAVSLPAPLSGHGVTGTDRLALICMHLAAGTVLIPVLALTIRPSRRPTDDAVAGPAARPPSRPSQQEVLPRPQAASEPEPSAAGRARVSRWLRGCSSNL